MTIPVDVVCMMMLVGMLTTFAVGLRLSLYNDSKLRQSIFETGYIRGTIDSTNAATTALRAEGIPQELVIGVALKVLMCQAPRWGELMKQSAVRTDPYERMHDKALENDNE